MSILRCTHCGTANREGSNFCNRCGTALHDQADQLINERHPADQPFSPELQDREVDLPQEPENQTKPEAQPETTIDEQQNAPGQREISQDDRHQPHLRQQGLRAEEPQQDKSGTTAHHGSARPGRTLRFGRATYPTDDYSTDDEWPEEYVSDADFLEPESRVPTRLVTGVQGLLEPIRLAGTVDPEALALREPSFPPPLTVPADQLRRIRTLVTEDPVLIEHTPPHAALPPTRFRLPWLILLLALATGLPILLGIESPLGNARRWPGVAEAYAAINVLSTDATVQILWAYDPATAGEMDLVMRPVVTDLIEQGVQVQVISLLPTGLATARRLWENTIEELVAANLMVGRPDRIDYWEGGFLPGGAPALALLANAPTAALTGHTPQTTIGFALDDPTLAIVVAAQAEDVQHWLEVVQPVTVTPVVAVTAAAADPPLRPYLASGQLTGLVSGFDGAATYHTLRNVRGAQVQADRLRQQLVAQNWGHIALITILVLGNLSALWLGQAGLGEQRDGGNRG